MRARSFDVLPCDGKTVHQLIDELIGIFSGMGGEVGVFGGGQNATVAEDLLYLKQVKAGFNKMSSIAVAQTVGSDLFFIPQDSATFLKVICTPPRSRGVEASRAPLRPPWRLGNSSTGLRCTDQKRRSECSVAFGSGTNQSLLPLESRICTRWRTESISPTCKRRPSPKRKPRL